MTTNNFHATFLICLQSIRTTPASWYEERTFLSGMLWSSCPETGCCLRSDHCQRIPQSIATLDTRQVNLSKQTRPMPRGWFRNVQKLTGLDGCHVRKKFQDFFKIKNNNNNNRTVKNNVKWHSQYWQSSCLVNLVVWLFMNLTHCWINLQYVYMLTSFPKSRDV